MTRREQVQQRGVRMGRLLDDLAGEREQLGRHIKAKRLRSLEVRS